AQDRSPRIPRVYRGIIRGMGGALFVGVESIMMSKFIAACGKAGRRVLNNMGGSAASAGGQVMVLVCVSLVAIMGMIAVVTDFSFLQDQRNIMQTAADSAAVAGAEELNYGDQVAAGRADAASNGYVNGTASV